MRDDYPGRTLRATYPDKHIQGQMRIWKEHLADLYLPLDPDNRTLRRTAGDFTNRKGIGRTRALRKLNAMLSPGAEPMPLPFSVDKSVPIALWRTLVPQESPFESDDPQLRQDCVAVGYIAVTKKGIVRAGVWGLVIPDHALGRALHRSAMKNPRSIVIDAHNTLLRLRVSAVVQDGKIDPDHIFHVRAGDGAFRCHLNSGTQGTEESPWVFAHTWLNEQQMFERQIILAEDGKPGEQLGESWLLPTALRPYFTGVAGQGQRIGKAVPFDCRNKVPMPIELARCFIEMLSKADVIWCEYGTSGMGHYLKGVDCETDPDQMVTVSHLRVANTSQIELIHTALDIYTEDGKLAESQLKNFVDTMSIASTIPGGKHDDILFNAALKRARVS